MLGRDVPHFRQCGIFFDDKNAFQMHSWCLYLEGKGKCFCKENLRDRCPKNCRAFREEAGELKFLQFSRNIKSQLFSQNDLIVDQRATLALIQVHHLFAEFIPDKI